MKTSFLCLTTATALALALGVAAPIKSFAQDAAKGGAKQLQLSNPNAGKPINTAADLEDIKNGDMIVMTCPKCKDVTVTTVTTPTKGTSKEIKTTVQHLCPGCTTAFESVGHGKAKTDKVVHKCVKCGSEDAFCCVVKKGGSATEGMEK